LINSFQILLIYKVTAIVTLTNKYKMIINHQKILRKIMKYLKMSIYSLDLKKITLT